MKKLFLFILFFSSISFAQLVKPSNAKTAIVSDSLSLKYFTSDSSNIYGGFGSFINIVNGFSNIALGYKSLSNSQFANNKNICLGDSSAYTQFTSAGYYQRNVLIGMASGFSVNPLGNIYDNVGIGDNSFFNFEPNSSGLFYNNIALGTGSSSHLQGYANDNISIGTNALIGSYAPNTPPNQLAYNICVGYNAGANLSWGTSPNFKTQQNILIGHNAGGRGSYSPPISSFLNHMIIIGNNPYYNVNNRYSYQLIISDADYFPYTNFLVGDFANDNFLLKASISIDSTGKTLQYHSTVGSTNRTAGIDSLLNGVDTVRTTAYDANSLVFITDLSAAGTPGHQYIDKINSVPGSYFIVLSKSALDTSLFNWFILKTY